jgi:hypothetical protein
LAWNRKAYTAIAEALHEPELGAPSAGCAPSARAQRE